MYLSELGYSELVQRLFEKITFFHRTPYQEPKSWPITDQQAAASNPYTIAPVITRFP